MKKKISYASSLASLVLQWKPLNVIAVNVIIWLMLSEWLKPVPVL